MFYILISLPSADIHMRTLVVIKACTITFFFLHFLIHRHLVGTEYIESCASTKGGSSRHEDSAGIKIGKYVMPTSSYALRLLSYTLRLLSYVLILLSYTLRLLSYTLRLLSYTLRLLSYVLILLSHALLLLSYALRLLSHFYSHMSSFYPHMSSFYPHMLSVTSLIFLQSLSCCRNL